jgi:hypothetical protein
VGSSGVPDVRVAITGEDRGVAAAIKELSVQLKGLKETQKEVSESSLTLASAFEAIIGTETILKLVEFGKETLNAAVAIEKLSQKTGVGAETLSVFRKAADDTGTPLDKVDTGITKLAKSIVTFQQGGTQGAAAFKALGLSAKDFVGLSAEEKVLKVTNALGSMRDGLQKTQIAQQLMGRGGAALIPVLDTLAGEGFDRVKESAKEFGLLLDDKTATSAAAAAVSLNEIKDVGEGIATQFEAGLLPALSDAADALVSGSVKGGDGFKKMGEYVGDALRFIVALLISIGQYVGSTAQIIIEEFTGAWTIVKEGAGTVFEAFKEAAEGNFSQAYATIKQGSRTLVDNAADTGGRIAAIYAQTANDIKKNFSNLFPSADEEAKRIKDRASRLKGDAGDGEEPPIENDRAQKARLAAIQAALKEELALYKAKNAAEEELNQITYDRGLESLTQYYAKKKQLAQDDADQTIATLQKERAAIAKAPTTGTDQDEIAKQQKLAAIDNQIAIAKITASTKQAQLDQSEETARLNLKEKELQFEEQIAAAQGKTLDAAEAHIDIEVARMRIVLAQAGEATAAIDAKLATYRAALEEQKTFENLSKSGGAALASLNTAKEELQLDTNEIVAKQRILDLERQRLPQLQAISAQLLAMARLSNDPQQIKAAEDYATKVKQIAVAVQQSTVSFKQFETEAGKALQGDLANFLGSTINSVKGIGDAFRQLGASAVASIQRIVAQLLVQLVTQKLVAAVTHQGQGAGSQVAQAAAAGTAQAAPLIAASTLMSAAGGTIIGAGVGLGVSAAALQLAASTLLAANAIGGGAGLAGGGFVTGPGTATSDSIPARLSAGEFVVRAAAVDRVGVGFLSAINGLRIPAIRALSIPRFAEGGLVQGGGNRGGSMDLGIGIGLDEGLILRHLKSKSAGRVILQHLSQNPKAATKALQRGQ